MLHGVNAAAVQTGNLSLRWWRLTGKAVEIPGVAIPRRFLPAPA